jgi:dTDP-4-dehydrorhamnose reductase
MKLDVGVIGANGQLGRYIMRVFGNSDAVDAFPLTRKELDVTIPDAIQQALSGRRLDVLINTSAAHGRDTEMALGNTFAVNTLGPKYLALYCQERGVDLAHISTDYVFRGDIKRPYVETDCAEPVNAYGISKLAGEFMIKATTARYYIVRVSGLYGVGGCRAKNNSNFVEMMLAKATEGGPIRVVDDQFVTPTYVLDIAGSLLQLIQTRKYGVYHMTNAGACSWYEFTKEIFRLAKVDVDVQPIQTEQSGAVVTRPMYSVLDNCNLRAIGLPDLRPWQEALAAYMAERQAHCE